MIDGCGEDEEDEDENVLHFHGFKRSVCWMRRNPRSQTDDRRASFGVSLSRF